jgi:hypothetical protein
VRVEIRGIRSVEIDDVLQTDNVLVGTVRLVNGIAVPDEAIRSFLEGLYVPEPDGDPKPLTFADGEKYLRALPHSLRGTYLWAVLREGAAHCEIGYMRLRSGCVIEDPLERLMRFCREEYDYYDGILSSDPNRVEPIDVLATVSMNSYVNNAVRIRSVHRNLAGICDPLLAQIPVDADLLFFDVYERRVRALLEAAIQVPGVLIPVATKVLHRKRPFLIPMLDNVVIGYYLETSGHSDRWPWSQDKSKAAAVASEVLRDFRDDLHALNTEIEALRETLRVQGYSLSPVRILELLVWTQVEPVGYYRGATSRA